MGVEAYSNNAQTSLNGAINNSVTSITVTSATGFPNTSVDFYRIIVEGELMLVTGGQGTTTWTVVRGIENTASASHTSGSAVTAIITVQGLRELQLKDKINLGTSAGHILDDEFDDGVLDASWTRVDYAPDVGNVTWTEGADVLSVKNVGAGAVDRYHALLKPLGSLTFPVTFECAMRYFSTYAINYYMFNMGFTNGTTYGSGSQILVRPYVYNQIATSLQISHTRNTGFNLETGSTVFANYQVMGGPFYWRIIWSAANTFQMWMSGDGVSWIQFGTNVAFTMTPTHFGIFTSHWGTNQSTIGSVEYVRIFESNKAGNL